MQKWAELYQNEVNNPSVAGLGTVIANPGTAFGPGYGRMTLLMGDLMFTAGRRFANEKWAQCNLTSYGYFFEAINANINSATLGATHFQEIPYVFGNLDSVGWTTDPFPSEPELREKHVQLATTMSRMWVSFAATSSPNPHKGAYLPHSDHDYSMEAMSNVQNYIYSARCQRNMASLFDDCADQHCLQCRPWRSHAGGYLAERSY